jgi:hypothetical protein
LHGIIDRLAKEHHTALHNSTLQGPQFMQLYMDHYGRFTRSATTLTMLGNYLERAWIDTIPNLGSFKLGEVEVRRLSQLCTFTWREQIWQPLAERIVVALLDAIDCDRRLHQHTQQVRTAVLFTVQWLTLLDREFGTDYGKGEFETKLRPVFLKNLVSFYSDECANFLKVNSISHYLEHAAMRIEDERLLMLLVAPYGASMEADVKKSIDQAVIVAHLPHLESQLESMLQYNLADGM